MSIFYYDTEKTIYPTQLDAYAAKQAGKNIFFYYYDKEFLKIDWKTEPTESLEELYKERAQQIRDEYEYVILCYSGGSDSTNILETFYYNNIHIDEIVMVGAFSQDSYQGSDENHNGDIFFNAKPTLNQFNLPNTKISVYDYTDWFRDPNNFTLIKTYKDEWSKYIGGFKSVHNLWWYDFKRFAGKGNNKKTAWIMGAEKTGYEHGFDKPRVRICDLGINDYGANYFDENFTRINFYTDPYYTKIMVKQAHVMKRLYDGIKDNAIPPAILSSKREDIINRTVYNLKNPLVFKSKKSTTTSISARDMFMLNSKDSGMYDMFLRGLHTIKQYAPPSQPISFFTRPYYL